MFVGRGEGWLGFILKQTEKTVDLYFANKYSADGSQLACDLALFSLHVILSLIFKRILYLLIF